MGDAMSHADEYMKNPPLEQLKLGGLYRHFKGGLYVVVAKPDDHADPLGLGEVIYVPVKNPSREKSYTRPMYGAIDGFLSNVPSPTNPKYKIPRFRLIGTAVVTVTEHGYGILLDKEEHNG